MRKRRQLSKHKSLPLIRTDKWQLHPTTEQRQQLELTVQEYRRFVRALIGVVYTHWVKIAAAQD